MSIFNSNTFNCFPSNTSNNTASTFGGNSFQTTFTQSQPATLALPQNTDSAFGRSGGRGIARGIGRGGRGGFRGGRGGRGGFRGGEPIPQMFSGRVQSISSIFGSAGGSQRQPDDGGRSFGVLGSGVPNPNQPLITQNLTQTQNFGRFSSREEPTLLGLERATQNRAGQRSLFDRPNTSTLQTTRTTNVTGNQGRRGLFDNNDDTQTFPNTTRLTGNGGLFNNPRVYTSVFTGPTRAQTSRVSPVQTQTTRRNSTFTADRINLQMMNRNLDRPTDPSQTNDSLRGGFVDFSRGSSLYSFGSNLSAVQTLKKPIYPPIPNSFTPQSSTSGTAFSILKVSPNSNSVQVLNNNLNPPLLNSSNASSTLQPNNLSTGDQTATTFSTNHPQIQATQVQQNIPENNNLSHLQNESASEEEEEEYEGEEEELSEGATTFAKDLQDLMANHQIAAPVNLFSNDTFTQNLVQFLKGFRIKAPRNKVLFRPQEEEEEEEESEAEIDDQEEPVEKEEEPVRRGIFGEIVEKDLSKKTRKPKKDAQSKPKRRQQNNELQTRRFRVYAKPLSHQ